jgi:hypothetical protein
MNASPTTKFYSRVNATMLPVYFQLFRPRVISVSDKNVLLSSIAHNSEPTSDVFLEMHVVDGIY